MSLRTPILTGASCAAAALPRSAKAAAKAASLAFMNSSLGSLSRHLDAVIFDHRVGKEFFRRVLERRLRAGAVGALDLDIEDLALTHTGNAGNAERAQRALDRLALRVENAGLQRDSDTGFHGNAFMGKLFTGKLFMGKRSGVACSKRTLPRCDDDDATGRRSLTIANRCRDKSPPAAAKCRAPAVQANHRAIAAVALRIRSHARTRRCR